MRNKQALLMRKGLFKLIIAPPLYKLIIKENNHRKIKEKVSKINHQINKKKNLSKQALKNKPNYNNKKIMIFLANKRKT